MPEPDWNAAAKVLVECFGEAAIECADGYFDSVTELIGGNHQINRANLIAYGTYCIGVTAASRLTESVLREFNVGVIHAAAAKSGMPRPDLLRAMFANRFIGYATAIGKTKDRTQPTPIANYFIACCTVNKIDVNYDDISPNPDELDALIQQGLVHDTAALRHTIARIRAIESPAIYSIQLEPKQTILGILINLHSRIQSAFEGLRRM